MKRFPASSRSVTGLSLVELMVAMVIGLIIMFAVVQVFMASQAASRLSEGAARVQENARFALDFIERDVRMAGHMGCVNDQAHVVKNMGDPVNHLVAARGGGSPLDFGVSIQGYEAPGTAPDDTLTIGQNWEAPADLPTGVAGLAPAPAGGSDILVLRFLGAEGAPVNGISLSDGTSTVEGEAARMARLTNNGVAAPSLFGIADCGHADIFEGVLANGRVTAAGVDLTRYTAQPIGQTMLYRAESLVYYVAVSSETGQRGLRRARADATGTYTSNEEVVEGVESLQLMYGLDATPGISMDTPPVGHVTRLAIASDVSTGTDADAANQWLRVGLVKAGLLMASPQPSSSVVPEIAPAALGVQFEPGASNDRRFRSTYEVSIALRNRLFGN
ncbi:PilW family protein [Xanthomonas sp. 60]